MKSSLLLATVVAAFALAACGKKEEAVVTPTPAPVVDTTPAATTPVVTAPTVDSAASGVAGAASDAAGTMSGAASGAAAGDAAASVAR